MPAFVYIAANRYEGCGHQHRTERAAAKCLPRIDSSRGPVKVWKVPRHNAMPVAVFGSNRMAK